MVRTLDAQVFSRALRAGALAVVREQELLNRINVFPVRDADTGANLAATLKAAAARLGGAAPEGVGAAARVAADGALDGARGNSGAIFAQFLHGLARAMDKHVTVDVAEFAAAARAGAASAYAALQEPREGTILTVVRVWAQELGSGAGLDDFIEAMHGGLVAARRALAETPRQLEVLARSHVVDAGGQGFVYFLEGLGEALRGGHEAGWEPHEAAPHGAPPFTDGAEGAGHDVDDRFRYCTEVLLRGGNGGALPLDRVRAAAADLGESLVVAGGETRLRVHLHTNEPQRFLAAMAALGVVEESKIDDMVLQQLAGREASIAIVADSTVDLPEDEAFRLGVVTVPLTVSLDGKDYLDGVDITTDAFMRRLRASAAMPRSSQPPAADFADTYRRLLEFREGVVSVHIAEAMSGTVQSARAAAQQVDPGRVRVIDSCSVSVGRGAARRSDRRCHRGRRHTGRGRGARRAREARDHRLWLRSHAGLRCEGRADESPCRPPNRHPAPHADHRVRRHREARQRRRRLWFRACARGPCAPGSGLRGGKRPRHGGAQRRGGGGRTGRRAARRPSRPPRALGARRRSAHHPRRAGQRLRRRETRPRLTWHGLSARA